MNDEPLPGSEADSDENRENKARILSFLKDEKLGTVSDEEAFEQYRELEPSVLAAYKTALEAEELYAIERMDADFEVLQFLHANDQIAKRDSRLISVQQDYLEAHRLWHEVAARLPAVLAVLRFRSLNPTDGPPPPWNRRRRREKDDPSHMRAMAVCQALQTEPGIPSSLKTQREFLDWVSVNVRDGEGKDYARTTWENALRSTGVLHSNKKGRSKDPQHLISRIISYGESSVTKKQK